MDKIIKRNGIAELFKPNKVVNRMKLLCDGKITPKISLNPLPHVNYDMISRKVINQIYDGVYTHELDEIAAAISLPFCTEHYEYRDLASRLIISNHHKNTECLLYENFQSESMIKKYGKISKDEICDKLFLFTCRALCENLDTNGEYSPILNSDLMEYVEKNSEFLESIIDYSRDFDFEYHGFVKLYHDYFLDCTLFDKSGVIKEKNQYKRFAIERPQHYMLRVALELWFREDNKDKITQTYNIQSKKYMTHATPTIYNAGTKVPQLSSCFLLTVEDDSLESIYDWMKQTAMISKTAGGIGSSIHMIRAEGSYIRGTRGKSNGIVPMLEVINKSSKYVDQGGGKRPGSHAIYLEPWHSDIHNFLESKSQHGDMDSKCRLLFHALWMPDEFFRCMIEEQKLRSKGLDAKLWYLMDPNISKNLFNVFDEYLRINYISDAEIAKNPGKFAFTELYRQYIREGKYTANVSAIDLWSHADTIVQETGVPYIVHKDAANRKSNQKNLGTIRSSNLCTEIIEYSSNDETAVCNLASICLNKFVVHKKPINADKYPFSDGFKIDIDSVAWFDFEVLSDTVKIVSTNLNQVIDKNYYPVKQARNSNMKHRPFGIGVQGLADTFSALWLPFGSDIAMKLDFYIFEHIYYHCQYQSCELAKIDGHYESFDGSPISQGKFQFDLWIDEHVNSDRNTEPGLKSFKPIGYPLSLDWESLRADIKKFGVRNSLTVAPMPTGSTSTIMGNSPCFEPHNGLSYKRGDKQGESIITNRYLVELLSSRNLWTKNIEEKLINSRKSSIQDIFEIPKNIREIFVCAWDISPKAVLNHAIIRAPFVDQSMSMSVFVADPNSKILTMIQFYAWRRGLKTSRYYLRRLAPVDARKTTQKPAEPAATICMMQDGCVSCGS